MRLYPRPVNGRFSYHQSDAQEFSCAANKENDTAGVPSTKGDIGRAVELLLKLPKWLKASDSDVAKHVGCDQTTASRHRRRLEATQAVPKSTSRTGKDGRTINTAKIGKSRRSKNGQSNSRLKPMAVVRDAVPMERMTALNFPHDPILGVATLPMGGHLGVLPLREIAGTGTRQLSSADCRHKVDRLTAWIKPR
jgi:hypothetical protein